MLIDKIVESVIDDIKDEICLRTNTQGLLFSPSTGACIKYKESPEESLDYIMNEIYDRVEDKLIEDGFYQDL